MRVYNTHEDNEKERPNDTTCTTREWMQLRSVMRYCAKVTSTCARVKEISKEA